MMNPAINASLNQQLMSGAAMGQQGMMAEAQGNPMMAAQLYEQAIGWIQQSMGTAQQWGVFIPHGVHAALAHAHACAGRAKTALGQQPFAWPHWQQALVELNQAIAQCPQFAPYHAAAGTVLMSMGNLQDAWRAFMNAQQLQPGEALSQQMLGMMQPMVPQAMAMPGWGAPQPPMHTAGGNGWGGGGAGGDGSAGGAQHPDWMKTVSNACSMLDQVFKTVGGFQDMMGRFE
jgi:hypothetical protein